MDLILLIASAIIFLGYITSIWKIYGVQKSISDSYYRLPKKWNFLFTLALWSFAIPVMVVGNNVMMFLAGAGICFVGAASNFKRLKMTKNVHMAGAFGGIIVGIFSVIFDFNALPLALVAIAFSIFLKIFAKNYIWWIEVTAFVTIWLTLYISTMS